MAATRRAGGLAGAGAGAGAGAAAWAAAVHRLTGCRFAALASAAAGSALPKSLSGRRACRSCRAWAHRRLVSSSSTKGVARNASLCVLQMHAHWTCGGDVLSTPDHSRFRRARTCLLALGPGRARRQATRAFPHCFAVVEPAKWYEHATYWVPLQQQCCAHSTGCPALLMSQMVTGARRRCHALLCFVRAERQHKHKSLPAQA